MEINGFLVGGCHSAVVAPHLPSEKELGAGKALGKKLYNATLEGDNSAFPFFLIQQDG